MIPYEEALAAVLELPRLDAEDVPVEESPGRVLAADVSSDTDLPPFDKSAMDGFAVAEADLARVPCVLRVRETVLAGGGLPSPVSPGECVKVMTGGVVPEGASAVVPVEDTGSAGEGEVRIGRAPGKSNICLRGEDVRRGGRVVEAGTVLVEEHVGLLASVGSARVRVARLPRTALVVTGDEIVPHADIPTPGKIRDSNSPMLVSHLRRMGLGLEFIGRARDSRELFREHLSRGLQGDVLITTGAVSMGDTDFLADVLRELGARVVFDRLAAKPGRPTTFARRGQCAVFALPGNPVTASVIFRVLVRPAIMAMMGAKEPGPRLLRTRMKEGFRRKKAQRLYFAPAELGAEGARILPSRGSADLVTQAGANALVLVRPGVKEFSPGDEVDVHPYG